jgi:hypothetical protein
MKYTRSETKAKWNDTSASSAIAPSQRYHGCALQDNSLALKTAGLGVLMFITFGIVILIREGGHASACIALGGNVGGFRHWLRGVWSQAPATDCSIKPYPPFVWAGGDIATIVGWFASVVILTLLLNRTIIKRGTYISILWAWWSFWTLGTLLRETYHAYSPTSVWEDTTQFVHVTGINPNLIGLPLAAIFAISLWLWWRVQ